MGNHDIRTEAAAFAGRIAGMGFSVWLAKAGTYGFISDDVKSRVLSFSFTDLGSLSGNYGPPSTTSGTGWRMDEHPNSLRTPDDVRKALYAPAPSWSKGGWRYYRTVAQVLAEYDSSSHFTKVS